MPWLVSPVGVGCVLTTICALVLIDGCGRRSASTAAPKSTAAYPALLGNGYNSLALQHMPNTCVKGEERTKKLTQVDSFFNSVESWTNLQSQMDFTIPGAIYLKSDTELAKFAFRARESQHESTFVLRNTVSVQERYLTSPESAYDGDQQAFAQNCGNKYISVVKEGGELYVGIKFIFSRSDYKEKFEVGGTVQSISGLSARIGALDNDIRKNGSVEVFFSQVGGSVKDLSKLFESGDLAACSLEQFEKCQHLIEAIATYSKDSFPASVQEGNAQPIGFEAEDYGNRPRVYEDPQVSEERNFLLEAMDQQLFDRDQLTVMKVNGQEYQDCDKRCIAQLTAKINGNVRMLKASIDLSFLDASRFLTLGKLGQLKLHQIDLPVEKPQAPWWSGSTKYVGAAVLATALGALVFTQYGVTLPGIAAWLGTFLVWR